MPRNFGVPAKQIDLPVWETDKRTADREGRLYPVGHAMNKADALEILRNHLSEAIVGVEQDERGFYPIFATEPERAP